MTKKIVLPPSETTETNINIFSDKSNQIFNNAKIINNSDGTEKVELELDDRIVTIIIDQSGSMTWNDNSNLRHDVAKDIINKIDDNYPGNISYNLIKYGSDIVTVLLFGIIDEEGVEPDNIDTLSAMFQADGNANYDGIRIIRNDDHYPTSILDGEIVKDGFMSKVLDSGLTEGLTYYYTIYTYDKNLRFSEGVRIRATARDRIVPRGISNFRTVVDSEDLSKGFSLIGSGVNKDDNTIGIWHMDEGKGKYLYDFSGSDSVLTFNNDTPLWYDTRFVPSGTSGLFFNGERDYASLGMASDFFFDYTAGTLITTTIMAWIFPYSSDKMTIMSSSNGDQSSFKFYIENGELNFDRYFGSALRHQLTTTTNIELNKWQHVCVVAEDENNDANTKFYINGVEQSFSTPSSEFNGAADGNYYFSIGSTLKTSGATDYFSGKITEASVHNTDRSFAYINSQIVENPILDGNGAEVDTEIIGIKDDNGDRLVVLDYEIPEDYNFYGGEVIIVKNEDHIPSWEEDGTIIHQVSASAGRTYVSDSDDFALGEKYYYRIFSKNSLGNISFQSDSPSLEIDITESTTSDYFVDLSTPISAPIEPVYGQLITPGNNKAYLRWAQDSLIDDRISRVKIYYSSLDYPVVNDNGISDGDLVFTGLPTDEKFVHRNLENDKQAYYTIVNIDKYGRSSNYNNNGDQVEDFLHAVTIPNSDADEGTIPLLDVNGVYYKQVDSDTISIGWELPIKSPENIDAFFDQTVQVYGSVTDEFGRAISEDSLMKMSVKANISREPQADDVFDSISTKEFKDIEAYDFFATRNDDGFLKAILRMTNNSSIISQIKEATFTLQLKAFLPKDGYSLPNTTNGSTDSLEEYESSTDSGENIFEYYSKEIVVKFTNPWEIELENRDNKEVPQRCYCLKTDAITKKQSLIENSINYNGIYMKATAPFVARAKVTYKGQPVERGSINVAVWDADSNNLCRNACSEKPTVYEGEKIEVSRTVLPPERVMSIVQGTESQIGHMGESIDVPISYVDIPLYSPSLPQAVKLFVKGEKAGYSSIKDLYILFQNILIIDLTAKSPTVDGKDISEQISNSFIINPDYPNYKTNSYDKSLVTYPEDQTVVQWELLPIKGRQRNIYSIDNVPVVNGVYSYIRNGVARNVFFGPIQKESKLIEEVYEVNSIIVYEGLTAKARQFIYVDYDPAVHNKLNARFLMEIDGGWRGKTPNQTWGGGGWKNSDSYDNPLWTDGSHYKKIKISRNPRAALTEDFASADCFRNCAVADEAELLELSSGQIININFEDENIEILHGDIEESFDEYTGVHDLIVGEDGYIDNGSAFIELEDEEVSDITYFYIRINKFVPGSGEVYNPECDNVEPINDCECLKSPDALTECDAPEWSPVIYVSGSTTVFVNNIPLTLQGGGSMETGIPPCPICLFEPLSMAVLSRKVTNYFYSETSGDTSNNYLVPVITEVKDNFFVDEDYVTLIKHDSDVSIRVKVLWKAMPVPDNTPVYVSVGDNTGNTYFVASQHIYYTETHAEGYSFVDVEISARKIPKKTITENIEIYTEYDENGKTERHVAENFVFTLDRKDDNFVTPTLPEDDDPSAVTDLQIEVTPYSASVERYNINTNEWNIVANMSEGKGNIFAETINNKIYVMGGLKNNSLNISNKNEEYNIVTNVWEDKTPMSEERFGGMSEKIGNNIYVIGGITSGENSGNSLKVSTLMEVYNVDTDTWGELENMPIIDEGGVSEEQLGVAFGTSKHVVINEKNYIYIMSGMRDIIVSTSSFNVSKYNDRILRYCIEDDSWAYSNILRTNELNTYERISPLSLVYDNKIIVFNGSIENNNNFIYPIEEFYINIEKDFETPSSGEWLIVGSSFLSSSAIQKTQTSMAKYDTNPSNDNAEYYITGGYNDKSNSLDILEHLVSDSVTFDYDSSYNENNASVRLSPMIKAKHGHSSVFSNSTGTPYIYVIGGYTNNREEEFIEISFDI